MTGETNLERLIANMQPVLDPNTYVFATTTEDYDIAALTPLMVFQEAEGTTLILRQETAIAHGLAHDFPCRRITLNIHSSLEAVGFIAAVATRLAKAGMGVNPVSAYFHDHVFVPEDNAQKAMETLHAMTQA
jgi:hypothetical protein